MADSHGENSTGPAIGTVEMTDGVVRITSADGSERIVSAGAQVFEGDTVATDTDSSVQIILVDDGIFTLGEEGEMVMDTVYYDPDTQDGEALVSVMTGMFVFVSGQIAKTGVDAMAITTPTSTIGIRGTKIVGDAGDGDTPTTITLLEEVGGHVGEIFVENGAGLQVLNQANQTVSISNADTAPDSPFIASSDDVNRRYEGAVGVEVGTLVDPDTGRPRRADVSAPAVVPHAPDTDDAVEAADDAAAADVAETAADGELADDASDIEMLDDVINALDGDGADAPEHLLAELMPLVERLRALMGKDAEGLDDADVLRVASEYVALTDTTDNAPIATNLSPSLFGLDAPIDSFEDTNEFGPDDRFDRAADRTDAPKGSDDHNVEGRTAKAEAPPSPQTADDPSKSSTAPEHETAGTEPERDDIHATDVDLFSNLNPDALPHLPSGTVPGGADPNVAMSTSLSTTLQIEGLIAEDPVLFADEPANDANFTVVTGGGTPLAPSISDSTTVSPADSESYSSSTSGETPTIVDTETFA